MEQRKNKIAPLLLGIIVGVIIVALSIFPIPQNARYVAIYVLLGISFSGGMFGRKTKNRRNTIIANIVLWGGIIVAIVITLI